MSKGDKKRLPGLSGCSYGEVYALLRQRAVGRPGSRAAELQPPHWDRPELVRFFKRLGVVPMSWTPERASLRVCLAATEMGGQSGDDLATVYCNLLGFSNDESEDSVCRDKPLCGRCAVRPHCRYADRKPSIKELPESERPRERLLQAGDEHLSDAELLAIIIGGGSKQESAVELARRLLGRFGGFRALAECTAAELSALKGIGPAKVAQIKAALAIARRFSTEQIRPGVAITGSPQLFSHFRERLVSLRKETFYSLLLDTKHRLIREEKIAVGSLSESVVHPREVFRSAVAESAAAVAFVHNHPSGNPDPSPEDHRLTRRLCEAGELVGIKVLDHLIVGRDSYFSFAEAGLIGSSGKG